MDHEKLVRVYLNIRKARDENTRLYKEKDAELKAEMEKVESAMLMTLQETNSSSIKTDSGIFYKQEEITPTGADWDAFYHWVAQNDAFDFLEKRIKRTAVKEYMEAHEGGIPPGVSVFREYCVRVRRA